MLLVGGDDTPDDNCCVVSMTCSASVLHLSLCLLLSRRRLCVCNDGDIAMILIADSVVDLVDQSASSVTVMP